MSSRAAFVSSCGDPFLTLFVHKLFKERFYDEVDKFYVNVNNHCGVPQEVISELLSRLASDKKTHIIYHPEGIGNGLPITEMTLISNQDLLLLLEDDGFIFTPGVVDRCFKLIESGQYDIVGSPRGSCGAEVWEALKQQYSLDYSGYGDVGPTWWPNFFFAKRNDFLRTDMNFASFRFPEGSKLPGSNYVFQEDNYGDTFVWASIQLRNLGLRAASVPQHKADPFEIEHKETKEQNWHESQQPFEWIHGGSLSAGWGGYLSGKLPDVSTDSAKQEIESRCAFWLIVSDTINGFLPFRNIYINGIETLIENAQLNRSHIERKAQIYRQVMNL